MTTIVLSSLAPGVAIPCTIDGGAPFDVIPYNTPLAIAPGNISIVDPANGSGLLVTITANPDLRGSPATNIKYEVNDSGTWISWGATGPGTYLVPISVLTEGVLAYIQVRYVNAAGDGAELATPLSGIPTNAVEYPDTDANAILWLDASETSTITGSPAVTSIANKLSGSSGTFSHPAGAVNTGTRTINSLNVLDFASNGYITSSVFDLSGLNLALHIVASIDGVNNLADGLFWLRSSGNTNVNVGPLCSFYSNDAGAVDFDGRFRVLDDTNAQRNVTPTGGPFAGLKLVSLIWNVASGIGTLFVNNVQVATETNTTWNDGMNATSVLDLMRYSQALTGALCEAVLTSDLTNRAAYTTYLNGKWNIF